MAKFRKLPVVIEAVQWKGDNLEECMEILNTCQWFRDPASNVVEIHTMEGDMAAPVGWWIIRGIQGEVYPCDNGVFLGSYEEAGDA